LESFHSLIAVYATSFEGFLDPKGWSQILEYAVTKTCLVQEGMDSAVSAGLGRPRTICEKHSKASELVVVGD
jgi:hypothetical protein